MQAKATKRGFYDQRLIEAGDVFHLKDKAAFSDKWMEPVDFKPDEKPTDETPSDISDDDIKAAVGMLDHANDGHWTAKGEPDLTRLPVQTLNGRSAKSPASSLTKRLLNPVDGLRAAHFPTLNWGRRVI